MDSIPWIGPQLIPPSAQEIIVSKDSDGILVITDTNHKILIKVKPCSTILHHQRVLLDPHDQPIATLREKNMSLHRRWNVFWGESHDEDSDMTFSIKTEHMIQFETKLQVFVGNKVSRKDTCDFMFKGSWSKRNCSIYIGDTSTKIAQMYAPKSLENTRYCKDKFMVTVQPKVDYAFVVAIIAIVDAMKSPGEEKVVRGVLGEVATVVGAFASFV